MSRVRKKAATTPERDADSGQFRAVSKDETTHVGSFRKGGETHAHTDLTCPLRYGVRDHAIDTDDAEYKRDPGGDSKHHECEGGPGRRAVQELSERRDVGDGEVPVDRPDRVADLFEKSGRTCPAGAHRKTHRPADEEVLSPEVPLHHRPEHRRACFPGHTVIMNVADDAYYLAPGRVTPDADAFAERGARLLPVLRAKFSVTTTTCAWL